MALFSSVFAKKLNGLAKMQAKRTPEKILTYRYVVVFINNQHNMLFYEEAFRAVLPWQQIPVLIRYPGPWAAAAWRCLVFISLRRSGRSLPEFSASCISSILRLCCGLLSDGGTSHIFCYLASHPSGAGMRRRSEVPWKLVSIREKVMPLRGQCDDRRRGPFPHGYLLLWRAVYTHCESRSNRV